MALAGQCHVALVSSHGLLVGVLGPLPGQCGPVKGRTGRCLPALDGTAPLPPFLVGRQGGGSRPGGPCTPPWRPLSTQPPAGSSAGVPTPAKCARTASSR